MKSPANKKLRKIGWHEAIDLPELKLKELSVKIDTGATTSVLHCSKIELVKKFRKSYVRFIPLDGNHALHTGEAFTMPFHHERKVKNSFGLEENRYIIKTTITLFGKSFEAEISLRDRSNLEFAMLLGRSAIRGRYIVDVSKANQSIKFLSKKEKKKLAK